MMSPTNRRLVLVATLFFCMTMGLALRSVSRVQAQPSSASLQDQVAQAIELAHDSFYDQAMSQLQSITSQNPGTDEAAQSLMEIAHIQGNVRGDIRSAESTYQTVVSQYPGTIESVDAAIELADLGLLADGGSFASYLTTLNQAAQPLGGPDIQDVMAGKPVSIGPTSASPQLQMTGLYQIYSLVASRLTGQQTVTQQDVLSAINVYVFVRQFYQLMSVGDTIDFEADVYRYNGVSPAPAKAHDTTPPAITDKSPPDGGPHTNQIEFDLSDGPINQSQVDLTTLKVTVDATDISKSLTIQSDINMDPTPHGKSDKPFEVAHVTYTSPTPFPDGVHNVTVNVSDYVSNAATANWSFTVHGNGGNSLCH